MTVVYANASNDIITRKDIYSVCPLSLSNAMSILPFKADRAIVVPNDRIIRVYHDCDDTYIYSEGV